MKRHLTALLLGLALTAGLTGVAPGVARADASSEWCGNLALNIYARWWGGNFDAAAQLYEQFLAAGCDPNLATLPQQ